MEILEGIDSNLRKTARRAAADGMRARQGTRRFFSLLKIQIQRPCRTIGSQNRARQIFLLPIEKTSGRKFFAHLPTQTAANHIFFTTFFPFYGRKR
jgi:hypothetical protein